MTSFQRLGLAGACAGTVRDCFSQPLRPSAVTTWIQRMPAPDFRLDHTRTTWPSRRVPRAGQGGPATESRSRCWEPDRRQSPWRAFESVLPGIVIPCPGACLRKVMMFLT